MEVKKRVIVVGAGASGMMAAIWAARSGAQVTLLEGTATPGKKLLVTGNGRCNLTNMEVQLPKLYYGSGAELAQHLIPKFDAKAVLAFFAELGLLTQEKNGYVYPYCGQAVSVLEVLLAEMRRLKVKLKLSEKIESLHKEIREEHEIWKVNTATWSYEAESVILACGSCAAPATGSDGSGYVLAKSCGIRLVKEQPALVPVTCKAPYLSALAGVRCRAAVSLWNGEQLLKEDAGELQWTKYGVSGIVVFQLSRFVSCAKKSARLRLCIDLLPDYTKEQLIQLLSCRAQQIPNEKLAVLLGGILNEKLIPVLLELAEAKKPGSRLRKKLCQAISQEELALLIQEIKGMKLEVTGTKSFDTAQVCAGGVEASQVCPDTLESKEQSGLYFAGELLDVDGPCGGYNLQWAWTSGCIAGCAAAKTELR